MNFTPKRVVRNYQQTIVSSPEIIFPLLCPERETEWLDGWDYKSIYPESGIAEMGLVFSTSYEGEKDTTWIITKHDLKNKVVQFTRVTPESRASILDIYIQPKDDKSSYVDITYTYTALSESGNKFIDEYTEEVFLKMMNF